VSKEGQRGEVAVFANLGDGSFAAPVTYTVGGAHLEYAMAIAAGDFNGDGVTDIAVTTMGEASPYPVAANVLLSNCE
jgi:FG-GAP-like repeat